MATVRLALLDDHRLFVESLRLALLQDPTFQIVGHAEDAKGAYGILAEEKPDLLVCDLMLRDTDGVSVARELRRRGLSTPMFILSMHAHGAFVAEALEAGVRGYALKDQPLVEIKDALRRVASGERYLAPVLGDAPAPREKRSTEQQAPGLLARLSGREREIFCRIIDGLGSRDIAAVLSISVKTVETHRAHINRKLDVHSPGELMRVAALAGLLAGRRGPLPAPHSELVPELELIRPSTAVG
jgi:DNA-binding NarL/FixJ family response regulator